MNRTLRGFATVTALGLMVLMVSYLSIGAMTSAQLELELSRAQTPTEAQAQAWKKLDAALAVLKDSWKPSQQSFSAWAEEHPQEGVAWESLSGRVNLNTVTPFLLAQPGFRETLKDVSIEKFTEFRSKGGPFADLDAYADEIRPEALKAWYTTHSLWNLNTADEILLENMVSQRTGNSSVASAVRASVRSFRQDGRVVETANLQWVVGAVQEQLAPLTTLDPELDTNEIPESLLKALVSNPDWAVTDPTAKTQALIDARKAHLLTLQRIREILQVPAANRILTYLGVKTRFLGGSVSTPSGRLDWVAFLDESESATAPRLVQTRWSRP